ncbi:MAG: hypothetical protein LCH34_12020 [Firmicutes bacterium]|nr:hypothetical protein [Bacillota bacterium]
MKQPISYPGISDTCLDKLYEISELKWCTAKGLAQLGMMEGLWRLNWF